MSPAIATAALAVLVCAGGGSDQAREQVLRAAFPAAERFLPSDVLLTDDMAARLAQVSRARVDVRLVTFYAAMKGADALGYLVIHSHRVRTKNQTLAVSFEPDGRLRQVQIVAFHEPPEYRATDAWLDALKGKRAGDPVSVGVDLDPISGATLSTRTTAEQARWLLAAFKETVSARAARTEARAR